MPQMDVYMTSFRLEGAVCWPISAEEDMLGCRQEQSDVKPVQSECRHRKGMECPGHRAESHQPSSLTDSQHTGFTLLQ